MINYSKNINTVMTQNKKIDMVEYENEMKSDFIDNNHMKLLKSCPVYNDYAYTIYHDFIPLFIFFIES